MTTTITSLPPETPALETVRVPAFQSTVSVFKPTRTYAAGGMSTGELQVNKIGGEARLTLLLKGGGGVAGLSLNRDGAAAVIAALRAAYPTLD